MEHKMVLCCTQNDAILVQRKLKNSGISGRPVKLPREYSTRSCSWGVQVAKEDVRRTTNCLQQLSIRWQWMEEGMQ